MFIPRPFTCTEMAKVADFECVVDREKSSLCLKPIGTLDHEEEAKLLESAILSMEHGLNRYDCDAELRCFWNKHSSGKCEHGEAEDHERDAKEHQNSALNMTNHRAASEVRSEGVEKGFQLSRKQLCF